MDNNTKIILKSKEGQQVEFPQKFADICSQAREANQSEPIPVEVSVEQLKIIQNFYELHNYDEKSIKVNIPLQSDKLKDEIDENSFKILEPLAGIDNVNKMTPLIDAAFFLNLEGLKNACLAAVSYEFVIGPTEDDLKRFKEKHNVVITPEEEKQYGEEFETMFRDQNEKKKKEMEQRLKEEQKQ